MATVVVVFFNVMPVYFEDITSSPGTSKPGGFRKTRYKMFNQNVCEKCSQRQLQSSLFIQECSVINFFA